LKWNSTNIDWINSDNSVDEVGCIHTTQGYDLNYSGIIFGHEIGYDPVQKQIIIHDKNYFDKLGKQSIKDPEDLKNYILNIYKTVLLRGIKGTYVYACDPDLRDYLAQYMVTAKDEAISKEQTIEFMQLANVKPFENAIPLYDLHAAAGGFSEQQNVEDYQWVAPPKGITASEELFACTVTGNSMNRIIPDGSICLFKKDTGGSRDGQIVLVEHHEIEDPDHGGTYIVKEYHSHKEIIDGIPQNESIRLLPHSFDARYLDIVLSDVDAEGFKVVGVFVMVFQNILL
jgi:uncharacterized protein